MTAWGKRMHETPSNERALIAKCKVALFQRCTRVDRRPRATPTGRFRSSFESPRSLDGLCTDRAPGNDARVVEHDMRIP